MNWLVLSWALTFGYLPLQTSEVYTFGNAVVIKAPETAMSTTLELEASAFDFIRAWGTMQTYRDFSFTIIEKAPWRADYSIGAELYYGFFAFGIKHEDISGIDLKGLTVKAHYNNQTTEIYVSLRGKVGL